MKQWFEQQKTRACVPHTPYTSFLKFVPFAGRVSGAATHAVGGGVGYGLLVVRLNFKLSSRSSKNTRTDT